MFPSSREDASNSVLGVDANLALHDNFKINTYYALSRTPAVSEGGDSAGGNDEFSYLAKMTYESDRYGAVLEHLKVSEGIRPEVGFLRREAFTRNFGQARFSPRPVSIAAIRRFVFEGELDHITGPTGIVETNRQKGTFRIELNNGDESTFDYERSFEFLPEPFEIADGVILPVAEYQFQDVRFGYQFGPQRVMPGFASFRTGSFFSGDRTELSYNALIDLTKWPFDRASLGGELGGSSRR